MKSIIEYNSLEAKRFFLKEESYFNFDLPKYFSFQNLLNNVSEKIGNKNLSEFYCAQVQGMQKPYPCNYEGVNYKFLNNKDGKFAWRPFQLIHPALYVSLVNQITQQDNWDLITEKFREFCTSSIITCLSIPLESENSLSDKATSVSNWWHEIEQKSIELSLDYEYVLHTDISDCYGSIYTHSIVWALHTKATGKSERNNQKLIGNVIDKHLQDMSFGQTNGIPQGSALMDFIAEMVLGFADLQLSERIKLINLKDFKILRYRDDYRIFTNNPQDGELILRYITEILIELGMRLNAQKTLISNNVVKDSLKQDKRYWLSNKKYTRNLQENLLLIHLLSEKFPNSGSLNKALNKFFYRIKNITSTDQNILVLISILIDIVYKNPRTYPLSAAILSKLLSLLNSKKETSRILESIQKRFDKIPNTGHLQIWLQRITIKIDPSRVYDEYLCKKVVDQTVVLWNSDWLNKEINNLILNELVIDSEKLNQINEVIESNEIDLFDSKNEY